MSKIFVDQVDPKTATTLTLGTTGDTIDIPTGVTIANSGTATGFGAALTGSTNNTVTTVTAANAITGEAKLLFDPAKLTIGNASEEDTLIVFDGNAQDFHIGLDDTDDDFKIGLGSTLGTTSHIVIDESGRVTKPLQPYFNVYPSALQTNMALAGVEVVWDVEVKDIGGNFASNTFTAPVTGVYAFSCLLNLNQYDTGMSYAWLQMPSSNEATNVSITGTVLGGSDSYYHLNGTCIIDMDASDTVTVKYFQSGGAQQVDVLDVSSHWYGYLLG